MLSARHTAQLCLAAATLTLVSTFAVIVAGSADTSTTTLNPASASGDTQVTQQASPQVTPLAAGHFNLQTVAAAK
jgi:hypothetical protein